MALLWFMVLAFLCSFFSSVMVFSYFIKKVGHFFHQPIRLDGPQGHLQTKQKRPTMGGFPFLCLVIFWCSFFSFLSPSLFLSPELLCSLGLLVFFGAIGLTDDVLKILHKNSKGLSAKKKLLGQTLGTFLAMVLFFTVLKKHCIQGSFFQLESLFYGSYNTLLSWLQFFQGSLGFFYEPLFFFLTLVFFVVFFLYFFFVLVGTSNGVNLTDGLDGLVSFPLFVVYGFLSYVFFQQQCPSLCLLTLVIMGTLLGFLWHNGYPGRLMMGDVGSLSLGSLLGFLFILGHVTLLLPLLGGIFVVESLSVILQVLYFRSTGGKRLFLMAPLHHHFEKKAWPENHVVLRCWIISLLLGSVGLCCFHVGQKKSPFCEKTPSFFLSPS